MKRTAVILAVACAALAACSKETQTPDGERAVITVDLSGAAIATKATAGVDETKVNSTQVYVFKPDGSYDGTASSESATVKVSCTTGERLVCAVVNAPSMGSVSTLGQLQAKISDLSENTAASFVMYGSQSKTVTASGSLSVSVSRLVARVAINGITTDWTAEAYKNAEFKITGVYMINVAGEYPYSQVYGTSGTAPSYGATKWYNKMTNGGELPSLLSDTITPTAIANKGTYSTVHSFYVYPNFTAEDSSETTWCARKTRLVIEATLGGQTTYYPITFKKIEPNRTYTVTALTITRPGASSPDQPLDIEDLTCTIVVTDWITGETVTETI